jgi:hypothetical protein
MDFAKPLRVKDGQDRDLGVELPWAYHHSWARIIAGSRAGLRPFGPPAKVRTCRERQPFKRVQDRYNLSVPNVLFSDLALPTVPQNQRDCVTKHVCKHAVGSSILPRPTIYSIEACGFREHRSSAGRLGRAVPLLRLSWLAGAVVWGVCSTLRGLSLAGAAGLEECLPDEEAHAAPILDRLWL